MLRLRCEDREVLPRSLINDRLNFSLRASMHRRDGVDCHHRPEERQRECRNARQILLRRSFPSSSIRLLHFFRTYKTVGGIGIAHSGEQKKRQYRIACCQVLGATANASLLFIYTSTGEKRTFKVRCSFLRRNASVLSGMFYRTTIAARRGRYSVLCRDGDVGIDRRRASCRC